jgi:hypothetical protein
MTIYRNYTDEDIIKYAQEVKSIAGLLRKLGLKPYGGNYSTAKIYLQRLKIDTNHWTCQAWNKGEQLKDWKNYSRAQHAKKHLVKLRGHQCENCKLKLWQAEPIPLEVHHIDGDRTNNCKTNLQLLCPNCHAMTDNHKGRKNKGKGCVEKNPQSKRNRPKISKPRHIKPPKICVDCDKAISQKSQRCKSCSRKHHNPKKINWPDTDTLKQMVDDTNYTQVGKKLGVSDNAVRKRIKNHS